MSRDLLPLTDKSSTTSRVSSQLEISTSWAATAAPKITHMTRMESIDPANVHATTSATNKPINQLERETETGNAPLHPTIDETVTCPEH